MDSTQNTINKVQDMDIIDKGVQNMNIEVNRIRVIIIIILFTFFMIFSGQ